MKLLRTLLAALLSLVPLFGCVGAQPEYPPSAPAIVFPSRAAIAQIPARAPAAEIFGSKDVAVDDWSVESPPLPSDGPYDDPSPWGALLRDLTKTRSESVSLSPAMRCAATEIGRFHLANHALPVERLRRFILARCGGDTPHLGTFVWFADVPSGVGDEQMIGRARDAFARAMEEPLSHGHHLVGLAAVRDAKHAAVVLAMGEDEARLEATSRQVDASRRVTLRGVARGEYAHITALVNRGDFEVSHCASDPTVAAPRFSLSCDLAAADAFDWVEVLGQKRGRVTFRPLADVLVYEGDASAVRYKVKSHGAPAPVTSAPELATHLLARINDVRKAAKLSPVALAPKQSAENERLAGTLLDAAMGADDDSADRAAIGLLAGWDVEGGTIKDGHFFAGAVAPTHDAMTWLEWAIEQPVGRLTLLDPAARVIAIGPASLEGVSGVGAAVTTYALFESADHAADEALFFRRVAEARAARGLPAPRRIAAPDEMRELTARVLRDETTPRGALQAMLRTMSGERGVRMLGYVLETNNLASVEVPDVFSRAGPLSMALTVTHHRALGAAWGQYVIFTLLPGGATTPSMEAVGTSRPARL
jgi:hypothetical protein